ncbi:HEAT repeat-containing protein [Perilla frutescens var. hirtella]|uniref:HEAT repeat-containing protein n=1 Tax=Perilla frutescens var. hirtella TaxID=608512 RepID=A0AAD4PF52_PERFH|nr:HEAT repeat-containing protein [Perilla frutescens var. hirtella]
MVPMMAAVSREKIAGRFNSIKYGGAVDLSSKLDQLRRLREELLEADSVLVVEFLSPALDLLSDHLSPVRKFITQMIGEIGLKHLELLPEIIPALVDVLKDDTPAVARQAISCGFDIFRYSLVNVAIQGLYSSDFDESLRSSWACVLKFRDEICSMAFKEGSEGRKLPALKFVESVVLLYTPDPHGSLEPPSDTISQGNFDEFNVSWLRGGHPILNVRDLSAEASQSLGLLLDQLRSPSLKSHSYLVIIVLIKSLSAVARKRPAFYGRILPVLLGLDPSSSVSRGMHLAGVHHALKNAFESCLNCTHPGAAPWRDRLVNALKEIKVGKSIGQAANEMSENNGRTELTKDSNVTQILEDEKPPVKSVTEHSKAGRKRTGMPDSLDVTEDDMSGKRARSSPGTLEGPGNEMSKGQDRAPSSGTTSLSDVDSGPVLQLVAMFAALVAQGEKAAASLEILISSISADLLAEVVMANIWNLPPKRPESKGDEESLISTTANPEMIGSDTHIKHLSLLLKDILFQSTSSQDKETGIADPHLVVSSELKQTIKEEPQLTLADRNIAYNDFGSAREQATVSVSESVCPKDIPSPAETGYTEIKSEVSDIEGGTNEIPGLSSVIQDDGLPENMNSIPKGLTDSDDANQEIFTGLGGTSIESDRAPTEIAQSLSTDRSEELSPKAAITDANSLNSSTATSVGLASQLVLPKIAAPVIHLADEEKDQLQLLAFARIIDAYKQVTLAGCSQVRFSILAHAGMEFPSELDPWKLLKAHVLSDYVNNEGHELTLRVLYRLFGEAEEDRDFFISTTARSVYETFLLQVAETLRDSFPASDKSLSRLLGEAPYLPKSIFEMLECLCSPGGGDSFEKELPGGDRVTQGLSTVWSLILLRPPIRDACLQIALKSAVHSLEEVRMKAIRLVANKLYPLSSISGKIEDFAKEMLLSVVTDDQVATAKEADGTHTELQKDENPSSENQPGSSATKEISPDGHQISASESISSRTVADVQRCMSLYFALCTKKHSLFRQIFYVYNGTSKVAKQAVNRQLPLLVRTIGSSSDLLDIISDPPTGSEGLVIQVVQTLTDGTVPSPKLVSTIKRLYDTKLKDIDILVPVLPFLSKDEVLLLFPHLVNVPPNKFQLVLSHFLQGLNHSTPVLSPAEALIAIHKIDPDRDGVPLKKVTDACNACFEQRHIFSQQVLAKVLNQLVEQIPLPFLFMRTVLQAIGAFPSLVQFIMEILSRLVSKQIWKNPRQWVGFVKCAHVTLPDSFGVLLQLPAAQLENALNRIPALKAPLVEHASQPNIRSTLPRSTLVVLGLESELPTSTQTQPTQNPTSTQTQPTQNPTSTQTQPTQNPTSTQTQPTQNPTSIQTQPTQNATSIQTQPTENQTVETGNSEKEAATDKSKESLTTTTT